MPASFRKRQHMPARQTDRALPMCTYTVTRGSHSLWRGQSRRGRGGVNPFHARESTESPPNRSLEQFLSERHICAYAPDAHRSAHTTQAKVAPGWSRPHRRKEASQDFAMGSRACIGYLYANLSVVRDTTNDGRDVVKEMDLLKTDEASLLL